MEKNIYIKQREALEDQIVRLDRENPEFAEEMQSKLVSNELYSGRGLVNNGYKFGKLSINRDVNEKALTAKIESIKKAHGVISPVLVVTARECLEQGLQVVDDNGEIISKDNPKAEKILVIIDGQHRREAVKRLLEENPDSDYDFNVYLPSDPDVNIVTMLRECNVCTRPWHGGDYLTPLICSTEEVDVRLLLWVKQHMSEAGDTASWLWATLNPSRVYRKAILMKAATDPETLREVAMLTNFDYGTMLYEVCKDKFSTSFTKLKVVPTWFIDKIDAMSTKKSKEECVSDLINFVNSISDKDAVTICKLKKKRNATKDQLIKKALNDAFKNYKQIINDNEKKN